MRTNLDSFSFCCSSLLASSGEGGLALQSKMQSLDVKVSSEKAPSIAHLTFAFGHKPLVAAPAAVI